MKPNRYDVDQTVMWRWIAPRALDPDEAPAVSFVRDGVEVLAGAMTPVHAEITLTSYGNDQANVEFIASENLANTNLLSDDDLHHAFIYSQSEGPFPVVIQSIEDGQTSIYISRALPQHISFPATLQFATYITELTSNDVTSTTSRNIVWKVEYSPLILGGTIADITPTDIERGRIIVARAFETGLDTAEFIEMFPEFAQKGAAGQNSFRRKIEIAQRMLINKLTCAARSKGKEVDQLFGEDFIDAHAYLTAYLIAKHNESNQAAVYMEQAEELIKLGLDIGWLDSNLNDEVDSGEEGAAKLRLAPATAASRRLPTSYYQITNIRPYDCRPCSSYGYPYGVY